MPACLPSIASLDALSPVALTDNFYSFCLFSSFRLLPVSVFLFNGCRTVLLMIVLSSHVLMRHSTS